MFSSDSVCLLILGIVGWIIVLMVMVVYLVVKDILGCVVDVLVLMDLLCVVCL